MPADDVQSQRLLHVGPPPDQRGLLRWMPGLYVLKHYQAGWLRKDIAAGLVVTAMQVPAGMAYATAAGLPAVYGLYATIVPLMAYFLFGPSRIMVLGPDSSLAPMIAAAILPLAAGHAGRTVQLAAMLAILTGAVGVIAGLLRLGFVTDLLAKPIRYGYMNGIALTVLVSQLPKMLGISIKADGLIERIGALFSALAAGHANLVALALGGGTLVMIRALKRFLKIPGTLLAVILATLAVTIFDLSHRFGIAVLGNLPQGLPQYSWPIADLHEIGILAPAALAIAAVSFADTSVLSRVYAAKSRSYVDPNQEMIGLGTANLATGLFQGFPLSSSSSRTPVAEASGSQTQVTGLVCAIAITSMLLLAPGLLHDLPQATLAGVVIASAIGLFEFQGMRRLYFVQRWEFWLSIAAFLGVALLGPVPGMLIAIGLALGEFVWDAWRPHFAILGRADGVKGYHDIKRYPDARQVPGLLLFRWDAPLFFANAEMFRGMILEAAAAAATPVRWVVVAAEPVTGVDMTSVDMLTELGETLRAAGIELAFAEMKDPVKDTLKRVGVFHELGENAFFPTVGSAVKAYREAHPVPWEDWEDQPATAGGEARHGVIETH